MTATFLKKKLTNLRTVRRGDSWTVFESRAKRRSFRNLLQRFFFKIDILVRRVVKKSVVTALILIQAQSCFSAVKNDRANGKANGRILVTINSDDCMNPHVNVYIWTYDCRDLTFLLDTWAEHVEIWYYIWTLNI